MVSMYIFVFQVVNIFEKWLVLGNKNKLYSYIARTFLNEFQRKCK